MSAPNSIPTPDSFFATYTGEVTLLETLLKTSAGIPEIISLFTTILIPKLIYDLNTIRSLSDDQKKQLLIDTVKFFISTVYKDLLSKGVLSNTELNGIIEESVLKVVDPTINMLIDIKNGDLILQPATKTFAQKLRTVFCPCCK